MEKVFPRKTKHARYLMKILLFIFENICFVSKITSRIYVTHMMIYGGEAFISSTLIFYQKNVGYFPQNQRNHNRMLYKIKYRPT